MLYRQFLLFGENGARQYLVTHSTDGWRVGAVSRPVDIPAYNTRKLN